MFTWSEKEMKRKNYADQSLSGIRGMTKKKIYCIYSLPAWPGGNWFVISLNKN